MDGIINILKPAGMTSMNVIARVRRILGEKKVGHIGTLDPDVTGVLPIFVGKATRAIHYVQEGGKTYVAEMLLGTTTDTQDRSGVVLRKETCTATDQEITDVLMQFVGHYVQIPPMYSAKKVDGKKLCDLARKGIEVVRKDHPVEIYEIRNLSISREIKSDATLEIKVRFEVDCSRGTYIRTLCHDVGTRLGCGACMSWLERTRSCGFSVENGVTLEQLEAAVFDGHVETVMAQTQSVFEALPRAYVAGENRAKLLNGGTLEVHEELAPGLHTLFDEDDIFVGLCQVTVGDLQGISKIKMERQFVI